MGREKRKGKQKQLSRPQINQKAEYDVQRNLQRVRQYRQIRTFPSVPAQTSSNGQPFHPENISNQDAHQYSPTSDPVRDYYFRLEDRMSDIDVRNESAHNDLRIELERKINSVSEDFSEYQDKLDSKLDKESFKYIFGGIITAVIIIVTIWLFLSYHPLVEDFNEHENVIHSFDKRLDRIENQTQLPVNESKSNDITVTKSGQSNSKSE